jgi:hypothetical protein
MTNGLANHRAGEEALSLAHVLSSLHRRRGRTYDRSCHDLRSGLTLCPV